MCLFLLYLCVSVRHRCVPLKYFIINVIVWHFSMSTLFFRAKINFWLNCYRKGLNLECNKCAWINRFWDEMKNSGNKSERILSFTGASIHSQKIGKKFPLLLFRCIVWGKRKQHEIYEWREFDSEFIHLKNLTFSEFTN